MEFITRIAEQRIRQAQEEGLFDDLPGKGKPLELEDDSNIPEDLRLTFKILKNAGCLPAEMEVRKEIYSLRQLLNATVDEETRRELHSQLNLLLLKDSLLHTRSGRTVRKLRL